MFLLGVCALYLGYEEPWSYHPLSHGVASPNKWQLTESFCSWCKFFSSKFLMLVVAVYSRQSAEPMTSNLRVL